MYADFYKLAAEPFQLTPDHRFFFGSSGHSQALAHLTYGLQQGEGFIVVTGDIGAGKTTLVSQLLATLDSRKYIAAKIVTTQLDAGDLLRTVVNAFGIRADMANKADMLRQIESFFTVNYRAGKRCLLLIDEAQNLTPEALEELRMLSNFQVGQKTPLQSFILGQPQFRALLNSPELEQLRQRIIANYHLGPLNEEETRAYIEHRLATAGWNQDPTITAEAFTALHRHTEGVPRRINTLCNRLFLYGFLEEKHAFDEEDVERVARDLLREENPDIRGKDLIGVPRNQRSPIIHRDHDDGLMARIEAIEQRVAAAAAAAAAPPADTRATDDLRRRLDMMEEYIRLRAVADRTYDDMIRRVNVLEEKGRDAPPPAPPIDLSPILERLAALESRPEPVPPESAPAIDLSPLESRLAALETRPVEVVQAPVIDLGPIHDRLRALENRPVDLTQPPPAPPVDLSPILDRLAALENRPEPMAPPAPFVDLSGIEQRLYALEGRPLPMEPMPAPAVDLSPIFERLSALENRPEPMAPPPPSIDLSPILDRLSALENRPQAPPAPAPFVDLDPIFEQLAALENRIGEPNAGPAPAPQPVENGRLEAMELRLAALPPDLADRIGKLEKALRRDEIQIGRRLDGLEHRDAGAPMTYVATLEERLSALEAAPPPEPAPAAPIDSGIDGAAVEALSRRLSQIESALRQQPPAQIVDDVKGRLTGLEQAVARMTQSAAIQDRPAREGEPRLETLERKLAAQEAMLRRAIGLAAALLERGRPQEDRDAG